MPVHFDSVGEALTDILTTVKNHPKHIIVIATDNDNMCCTPAMLSTILRHQAASVIGCLAGFSSIVPLSDGKATIVCYTEALYAHFREKLTEIAFLSPEELVEIVLHDLTVFTPTENGLQFSFKHTEEYIPFVRSLKVGDRVRCIINGEGVVVNSTTECCDNENLKPGDVPMTIFTVEGTDTHGGIWCGTYLDDGTNISQGYTGRTLRPITD